MKRFLHGLLVTCMLLATGYAQAQCSAALLNWDNLDYYYNSGSNVQPYGWSSGNFISNTQEQNQRFGIGTNAVEIAVSAAGIVDGENATHTGNLAGYTGEDAMFTPSANAQTITITFDTEVQNVYFVLYDVDATASFAFAARNQANVLQNVNVATFSGTILTVTGGATARVVTANATNAGNSVNTASAAISCAGPVKTITITMTLRGTDPVFWLSDIHACVPASFPTNYHRLTSAKPFNGQPDYFIVTPDNNSVYMMDPISGKVHFLFTDASNTYVNSFGYDQINHILYYVTDGSSTSTLRRNNKSLKKYDFETETISTVIANIGTTLNLPTMDQGVESGAAAYYDGHLYLGIEGGRFSGSSTRESIIYRINLTTLEATQVWAVNAYSGSTALHDWADFIVKDGMIIDLNSARNGSSPVDYSNNSVSHFNMMSSSYSATYMNPVSNSPWAGQAGLSWNGTIYNIRDVIEPYNMSGSMGAPVSITTMSGPAWVGGAGDASEPFRPKGDFGDAPASYDPNPDAPAVHEQHAELRIGANFDREWLTRGQSALANSDNFEDGLPYVTTFNPITGQYLTEVSVYNNTGGNATLGAWLDFNGNGVFDAAEGIVETIGSVASLQTLWLYWPSAPSTLANGTYTYLRLRITTSDNVMTTANATGYYNTGEVEDYRVPVNSYALNVQAQSFEAILTSAKTVKLDWSMADETDIHTYIIERNGTNGNANWEPVAFVAAKNANGEIRYESLDGNTLPGTSYYRIRMLFTDGSVKITNIRKIENRNSMFSITVAPNPVISKARIYITSNSQVTETGNVEVLNSQGLLVHQQNVRIQGGTNTVELPVFEKLAAGTYLVRITCNKNLYTQTLIKTR